MHMDGKALKQWIIKHGAWNKTIDAFWDCFSNYIAKEKDEFNEYFGYFDKSKLTLWRKEARLTVRNWDEADSGYWSRFDSEYNSNYEFVDMLIVIGYGEEQDFGEYVLRFNINGESFDVFFGMKSKEWFVTISNKAKKEREIEIVEESLRQGVDVNLISKITGVNCEDIIKVKIS